MHGRDVRTGHLLERACDLVDRKDGHVRHFEQNAMTCQLRQRRSRPAETDIEQLNQAVLLSGRQFHVVSPSSTLRTTSIKRARSTGLVMKAFAPAACTSS